MPQLIAAMQQSLRRDSLPLDDAASRAKKPGSPAPHLATT
jgi:hypothetical protein